MEDVLVGMPRTAEAHGTDDPVERWRLVWEQDMAAASSAAEAPDGNGDPRLALRRRDYGSYLFIGLDLVLAIVATIVLSIPLVALTALLFVVTGHSFVVPGGTNPEFAAWLTAPLFTLCGLFVTEGALALVVWYRLARQKLGWAAVGLGRALLHGERGRAAPGRAVLFGLGVGAVGLLVSSLLNAAIQMGLSSTLHKLGLDMNGQEKLVLVPLQHAPLWIVLGTVATGTFIAPLIEETFFRGYIFRAVAVRKGVRLAYPVSAGSFALIHLMGGADILPLVPGLFVIGLLLCFAYRRTGNLLANVTAHALNNGAAFALALLPLPFHF